MSPILSGIPTFQFAPQPSSNSLRVPPPPHPTAPSRYNGHSLTVSDLEQGFGDDAAGDVEGLAAVVAHVGALGVGDGQVAALGHGEAAGGLRRLVGEEQVLQGGERKSTSGPPPPTAPAPVGIKLEPTPFTWLPSCCQKMAGCGFPVASHWKVTVLPTPTTWFLGLTTNTGGTGAQPGRNGQQNYKKHTQKSKHTHPFVTFELQLCVKQIKENINQTNTSAL